MVHITAVGRCKWARATTLSVALVNSHVDTREFHEFTFTAIPTDIWITHLFVSLIYLLSGISITKCLHVQKIANPTSETSEH